MNENSNIPNEPNWEKLLEFLEQDVQDQSLLSAEEQRQLAELKTLIAETSESLSSYKQFNSKDKWDGVKARLNLSQTPREGKEYLSNEDAPKQIAKSIKWPRISVAAAAIAFLAIGIYFFISPKAANENKVNTYATDIAPGKQGATLTLASGEKIRLSDAFNGELAKQANVTVSKLANGELMYEIKSHAKGESGSASMNTLTTAKGETYQVRLPDGSQVWLNAASSLTYSANLNERGKRRVRLEGEAYFQISKDKAHPFVVSTAKQEVEVLGTHFNVNAYPDEPSTKTALVEGSVKVNDNTVLKPGEQSILENGKIAISPFDPYKVTAWKNGKFVFDEEDIESIMRKLSRWYNVEVIYQGELKDRNFTASISRFDHISKILEKLSYTNKIHFKIEGRRVTVME
jgi:transmembrane sensor